MTAFSKQQGFSIVELVVIVIGVAILGVVGYVAIKNFSPASSPTTTSTTQTSALPAKLQSKSDVHQAIQSLNNDQIDIDLDPSQLDAELTKLL